MPDFNNPAFPPDQAPPLAQMPAAGEAAIALDVEWFRLNPDKTRRWRPVHRKELPRELRKLGAVNVQIQRVDSHRLVCLWFDRRGRPVNTSLYIHYDPIVPGAPDGTVSLQRTNGSVRVMADGGTSAADREWFAQHPGETAYVRSMTAEEMLLAVVPAGFVCVGGEVEVQQIEKGVRERRSLSVTLAPAGAPQ
jgi:hypothetical protein